MANNTIKRVWKQAGINIEDLSSMLFQAESGGHTFAISGANADGNPVALSGTPAGVFLRPDNTDVALTCSVSNGVVYATLPAECYAVQGRGGVTIFLTSGGQKSAIYAAVVSIGKTTSGNVSPGTTASVVDLINAINAAIAQIPASDTNLKAAMAPTYSPSAVYAVGDYAWNNGVLYRCTTAITSGETWTSGHWTAAAIGSDSAAGLRDLKSAINNDSIIIDWPASGSNKRIGSDGELEPVDYWKTSDYIELNNELVHELIIETSYTSAYNAFYDSSKEFIGSLFTVTANSRNLINPPTGAVYMRLSSHWPEFESVKVCYNDTFYEKYGKIMEAFSVSQHSLLKPYAEVNGFVGTDGAVTPSQTMLIRKYKVKPNQKLYIVTTYGYSAPMFAKFLDSSTFVGYEEFSGSAVIEKGIEYVVKPDTSEIWVNCYSKQKNIGTLYENGGAVYLIEDTATQPLYKIKNGMYDSSKALVSSAYKTPVYEVEPYTLYKVAFRYGWQAVGITFWDENEQIKKTFFEDSTTGHDDEFVILTDSDTKYIGITTNPGITDTNPFFAKYGVYPMGGTEYSSIKWCVLGDSLTEINFRASCNYYKICLGLFGMSYYNNMGISGTGYAKDNPFYQRIHNIDTVDFDIMTIFGSGNDLFAGLSLGTYTDTELTTLAGYINKAITEFCEKAPTKKLALITPTPWASQCNGNLSGTMEDYSNLIVQIARYRGVPCLDLYHESGIMPWLSSVRSAYYSKDGGAGTHPNAYGHKKFIAPKVYAFLKSLLDEIVY